VKGRIECKEHEEEEEEEQIFGIDKKYERKNRGEIQGTGFKILCQ
jgi:hypothetical protein